jgi:hypothetical protein
MTWKRMGRRGAIGLCLVLAFCLAVPTQTLALDLSSYFSVSYNATVSRNTLSPGENITATITGKATCNADLPLSISESTITGRVLAQRVNFSPIILNSNYTVTMGSLPNKKGGSIESSQTVTLTFPPDMPLGQYSIIGEVISARIKAVLWFDVTSYAPSNITLGDITLVAKQVLPPVIIPPPPTVLPPGTTILTGRTDDRGIILLDTIATSPNNQCTLTINKGVKALDATGMVLQQIGVAQSYVARPASDTMGAVSLNYNLTPEGATFDPPIMVTIKYSREQLPPGAIETRLFIARWDTPTARWVEIPGCIVDTVNQTISARIGHFSNYGVMAPTAPATFTISDLIISPVDAPAGQTVSVSTTITNNGDLPGTVDLSFTVNYELKEKRTISNISGKSTRLEVFSINIDKAGSYRIGLNGSTGTLVIRDVLASISTTSPPFSGNNPPILTTSVPSQTGQTGKPSTAVQTTSLSGVEATSTPSSGTPDASIAIASLPATTLISGAPDFVWWPVAAAFAALTMGVLTVAVLRRRQPNPEEDSIVLELPPQD